MFLSTFEKQLDAKRRIVVPADYRALVSGPFEGVVCLPSVEADCLEGGGQALFQRYKDLIEGMPFGDPLRSHLETSVYGGMTRLSFDSAGRITLPDEMCEAFGLKDWVVVVGLGDRFQVWEREAFRAHRAAARLAAREGLPRLFAREATAAREAA